MSVHKDLLKKEVKWGGWSGRDGEFPLSACAKPARLSFNAALLFDAKLSFDFFKVCPHGPQFLIHIVELCLGNL